jgi:hypothetical protein
MYLQIRWAPVAHTCNPSSNQEDHGSRPARNSSQDSISKKTRNKKGLVAWLKVKALSSNPSTAKTNQSNKQKNQFV